MTRAEILSIAKPILFSMEMVRAIQEGRKTQTRRVMKSQPFTLNGLAKDKELSFVDCGDNHWGFKLKGEEKAPGVLTTCTQKPRYQPGDYLYVRETWSKIEDNFIYAADPQQFESVAAQAGFSGCIKWRPSIHMPKKAARIFLRVTGVRAEWVQDISDDDAIAEGLEYAMCAHKSISCPNSLDYCNEYESRGCYARLWSSIYAAPQPVKNHGVIIHYESYPWGGKAETRKHKGKPWHVSPNPWVWVYEFERVVVDG